MNIHSWIYKQFKKSNRIYIMTTRMGSYLNGLIFLMFLLSIGYSNNLLLIFTLFLFGLNLIWVIQTHFHLHVLKLESIQVQDGHALTPSIATVKWGKAPQGPYRWELKLESENHSFPIQTTSDKEFESLGQVILPNRGIWNFQHLRIKSEMPFGLYQSWIYLPIQLRTYAYPIKLNHVENWQVFKQAGGEFSGLCSGPHDIWNLAPYQGEEYRKISWKHYAKSGDLVVKEGEDLVDSMIHFKVPSHGPNKEYQLSLLATQMVHCARTGVLFSLETHALKTQTASHERHLHECLRELAGC